MSENDLHELGMQLGDVLKELLDRGFALPLYAVSVAVNGTMIYFRYEAAGGNMSLDCELLAQYVIPPGFQLPINTMFIDANGEAVRVRIETGGYTIH